MHDLNTIEVVNHLFERMIAMNPAFKQAWPTEEEFKLTKKEWIVAFIDANLSNIELIKKGLRKMRLSTSPFIPAPGQFIEWCRFEPEDINAPSVEAAYKEACEQAHPQSWKKEWSHDAVKDAYRKTGSESFINQPRNKSFDKFSQHYLNSCNDYAAGKITPQIEHKKPLSVTDLDEPVQIGKYDFVRPGVLRQYEFVKTCEESMAIIDKLLGKGDSKLKGFIKNLEAKYKSQGLV